MQKYCNSEITSIFDKIPIVENLARKKFVVLFVLAMIKTRAVQFCEIAQALNDKVKAISNEVRIQDFFREVPLNYEQVALLLAAFLPRRGKVTLCIDRTEWDFGKCQVNILMIVVRCKEITLPLYWELLENNSGNSHTDDRIDLLKKCIELLGAKRIGLFLGDREFIGHRWLKFLTSQGIRFCVRVPKHHKITQWIEGDTEEKKVEQLLAKRKTVRIRDCMVDGVWGSMYAKRVPDDILFVFGTAKMEYLDQLYQKRWTIECFFQNIKKRGFDLEDTHLQKTYKLKKLVAMVCIAYAFCANMGLHHHKMVEPIPIKNHGYKANSFSRKGINLIREGLRRDWKRNSELFYDFVLKFLRWIQINPNNLPLPHF
ncbi:MAG: IS4 family transposase [Bacteroidetes bacterium]|nr:IS4 family transposase [Bacteroidota bacterium]